MIEANKKAPVLSYYIIVLKGAEGLELKMQRECITIAFESSLNSRYNTVDIY